MSEFSDFVNPQGTFYAVMGVYGSHGRVFASPGPGGPSLQLRDGRLTIDFDLPTIERGREIARMLTLACDYLDSLKPQPEELPAEGGEAPAMTVTEAMGLEAPRPRYEPPKSYQATIKRQDDGTFVLTVGEYGSHATPTVESFPDRGAALARLQEAHPELECTDRPDEAEKRGFWSFDEIPF